MERVLTSLNPNQEKAVVHTDGYLLVLAGAGSGKTRVLTYKVAWLLGKCKIKPWEVLAVTFTNKAAEEMKTRVESLIGKVAKMVWIGTFHSFCAKVLRKYSELLGYSCDYTIYDSDDSRSLIRRILKDRKVAIKLSPAGIAERISRAKNGFILPADYPEYNSQYRQMKEIYQLYQETLKSNNAMDFDDLLINAVEVFRQSEEVLNRFSFRYILVDEYQDTNNVQYELLKLLSLKHKNLTVVGDEDQSIYGFRGANIRNILRFQEDFPGARIIRLEDNYRSTQTILKAASQVVSNNKIRLGKELRTENQVGEKLSLFVAETPVQEAMEVVNIIKKSSRQFNDFVVLYRINAQSRNIEEAMRLGNIPYIIVGGIRFYERREIKDALAYLRVLINPSDLVALQRIINTPHRGIGPGTFQVLVRFAEDLGIPVYFALGRVDEIDRIPRGKKKILKEFFNLMERYRKNPGKPAKLINTILGETGYWTELMNDGGLESESRVENLKELIRGASEYENLSDFIESVSLFTDIDEWDPMQSKVTLMTVHNAKGLEFPIVFIIGLEDGLFPHYKSLDDETELEEERRLFHVGITRAKEKVYLSYAIKRKEYGDSRKSRFVAEISPELMEKKGVINEYRFKHRALYSRTF